MSSDHLVVLLADLLEFIVQFNLAYDLFLACDVGCLLELVGIAGHDGDHSRDATRGAQGYHDNYRQHDAKTNRQDE